MWLMAGLFKTIKLGQVPLDSRGFSSLLPEALQCTRMYEEPISKLNVYAWSIDISVWEAIKGYTMSSFVSCISLFLLLASLSFNPLLILLYVILDEQENNQRISVCRQQSKGKQHENKLLLLILLSNHDTFFCSTTLEKDVTEAEVLQPLYILQLGDCSQE